MSVNAVAGRAPLEENPALPHICFVAPDIYPVLVGDTSIPVVGGAEVQQCFLARGLRQAGYRVSIVTGDFGQPDQCEIDGIRVFKIIRSTLNIPVLRYLHPRLTSIWQACRRANADIYYQRCASAVTGVTVAYANFARRKAVFAVASDIDLLPGKANSNAALRERWLFVYGLRRAAAVVLQNPLQQQRLLDWTGRQGVQIPSCYALPAQRSTAPGGYILWVGMMRLAKRPELVLDLAERLPGLRFRLIGGPSSSGDADDYFRHIEARARTLPNVEFLGFVPYAQAEQHFDGAALLLNTSVIEGFPNTFLQAWARAVPSVSFFDCGARDAQGTLGAVVPDVDAMVAQLALLMGDDAARAALGQRCLDYFQHKHHVSAALSKLQPLLAQLQEAQQ
ncbi:glycosyltransferase [Pseudoduganella sp. FT93W]|uniref:Glycosyltransferase n=1 Tax=Duganella fentianensis TaxID=2692177 RepID=A0A845I666_9BURK|nr:glycosyltransferase family 4 protein [Duganella fentianensis]MYN47376.1 glycosyltransferase [Duganella fentianensis]